MRKLIVCLLGSALLSGCDDTVPTVVSDEPEPQIGRYQIVEDSKHDGVFWVDTTTGRTEQCQWVETSDQSDWMCFVVKPEE